MRDLLSFRSRIFLFMLSVFMLLIMPITTSASFDQTFTNDLKYNNQTLHTPSAFFDQTFTDDLEYNNQTLHTPYKPKIDMGIKDKISYHKAHMMVRNKILPFERGITV